MKLFKQLLVAPAALGLMAPLAVSAGEINFDDINQYSSEEQVTSVDQLSDVLPTDWAYQALSNLIERYGCVAGYPDGTYKGGQKMTRYEAAALLNACLDRVTEITDELKRLMKEFEKELAILRGRVDGLEAKVGELEATQFSTTTKLRGVATFVIGANSFSGDARSGGYSYPLRGVENIPNDVLVDKNGNTIYNGPEVREQYLEDYFRNEILGGQFTDEQIDNFKSEFEDLDDFRQEAVLEALLFGKGANLTPAQQIVVAQEFASLTDEQQKDTLFNRGFTNTQLRRNFLESLAIGRYTGGAILPGDKLSRRASQVQGATVFNYDLKLDFDTSFTGKDLFRTRLRSGNFKSGNGAFGGTAVGLNALEVAFEEDSGADSIEVNRLFYQFPLGSSFTATIGGRVRQDDMLAVWPSAYPADTVLDIFTFDAVDGADTQSWYVGLQWTDVFWQGNDFGMAVGQPTFLTSSGDDDLLKADDGQYAWEWWYKFQVTDNISVTPALYYLSAPYGQLQKTGGDDTFTNFGGLVKTTFRF